MIIVDTGAFFALFNSRDTFHLQGREAFSQITEPLITTYPVRININAITTIVAKQGVNERKAIVIGGGIQVKAIVQVAIKATLIKCVMVHSFYLALKIGETNKVATCLGLE